MEKETSQDNPSHHLPTSITTTIKDEQLPRKPLGGGGGGGSSDRLKRDEWSEGAVSTLLEAYESKWILRNRAKLKGHDWEDVARHVSSRANCTKSPKTQTQCKNKIESMKKRYRSESATADSSSSWPLYSRLDLLLRGNGTTATAASAAATAQPPPPPQPPPPLVPPQQKQQQLVSLPAASSAHHSPSILLEPPSSVIPQPPPPPLPPSLAPPLVIGTAQNSHGSNGVDRAAKEDGVGTKLSSDHVSDKNNAIDTDSSTPALVYSDNEKLRSSSKKMKMKMDNQRSNNKKRRRSISSRDHHQEWEIADSIRWLAEVVVRSEQAKMDTMRELEKMRIEAEAKRGEMDLKRTEIIANTQLEIAKLFAGKGTSTTVDSSLRIGRN